MGEILQKRPWVAIVLLVAALAIAGISLVKNFGLGPTKFLPIEEQIKEEADVHTKLQKELKEKFGVQGQKYGLPDNAGIPGAGTGGRDGNGAKK